MAISIIDCIPPQWRILSTFFADTARLLNSIRVFGSQQTAERFSGSAPTSVEQIITWAVKSPWNSIRNAKTIQTSSRQASRCSRFSYSNLYGPAVKQLSGSSRAIVSSSIPAVARALSRSCIFFLYLSMVVVSVVICDAENTHVDQLEIYSWIQLGDLGEVGQSPWSLSGGKVTSKVCTCLDRNPPCPRRQNPGNWTAGRKKRRSFINQMAPRRWGNSQENKIKIPTMCWIHPAPDHHQ